MPPPETGLDKRSRDLASILWDTGCLEFGDFTLTSGQSSPFYLDLRTLPSHPDSFDRVVQLAAGVVENASAPFDAICAVATGGLPAGTLLAHKLGLPLTYVRKKKKQHGEGQRIEGTFRSGDRLLVVDDISTTGGSLLGAVKALRDREAEVDQALVLADRDQGATRRLAEHGVDLVPVAGVRQLVEELRRTDRLDDGTAQTVIRYLEQSGPQEEQP